jgi:hypothetical protein
LSYISLKIHTSADNYVLNTWMEQPADFWTLRPSVKGSWR